MDYNILSELNLPDGVLVEHYGISLRTEDGALIRAKLDDLGDYIKDTEALSLVAPFVFANHAIYDLSYTLEDDMISNPDHSLLVEWASNLAEVFGDRVRILVDANTAESYLPIVDGARSRRSINKKYRTRVRLNFWFV